MHDGCIRQLFPLMRYLADIPDSSPFFAFNMISLCECIAIGCAFRHEVMLYQQMVDEERALIVLGFLVNPEFILRDVRISVMLAKICELLVDMSTDVCAIDYPNLIVTSLFVHVQIGWFERLFHRASS